MASQKVTMKIRKRVGIKKILMLAMSLMTRIPMPKQENIRAEDYAHAAILFPLAGLLIGLGLGLMAWLYSISSASSLLMAAILTVLWAVITGGLHLKGVGSSADAWIGGIGDEDKTHRILNDQITGDAGTTAIAAVLILKFAALTVLVENQFIWSIIFAPVFGRALMLLMFLTTPCVRAEGLASAVTTYLPRDLVRLILAVCLLLAVVVSLKGLVLMLVGFWLQRRLVMKRLGGCTLDTAGASVELGETFWLIGVALLV
jgi:adenosylcobinamide-GDP ribazoletransferase